MLPLLLLAGAALVLWRLHVTGSPVSASNDTLESVLDDVADDIASTLFSGDASSNAAAGTAGGAIATAVGSLAGTGSNTGFATLGGPLVDTLSGSGAYANVAVKVVASAALALVPAVSVGIFVAGGGIAAAGLFAVVAAFVVIWLGLIISAVSEADLDMRKEQIKDDTWHTWLKLRADIRQETLTLLQGAFPSYTALALDRTATHFADGFAEQLNALSFLNASKEATTIFDGWALGGGTLGMLVPRVRHLFYAWKRGRFVGFPDIGAGVLPDANTLARIEVGLVPPAYPPKWVEDPTRPVPYLGRASAFLQRLPTGDIVITTPGKSIIHPSIPPWVVGWTETIPPVLDDRYAAGYRNLGRLFANAAVFTAKMREPRGLGLSEVQAMQWLVDNGVVDGSIVAGPFSWTTLQNGKQVQCTGPGYLSFMGKAIYWRYASGQVNCCVRYDDAAAQGELASQVSALSLSAASGTSDTHETIDVSQLTQAERAKAAGF